METNKRDPRILIIIGFAAVLAIVVAVIAISNGGSDDSSDSSSAPTASTASEEPASSGDKPEVEVPDSPPPKELVSEDLKVGEGDAAKTGDQVSVQYVGVDYETGEEFDASYDRGEAFPFELGAGNVIPGWDEGVVGMKVGGQRKLTIPPDLAYGEQGQPPSIGPNATLVFVIDLESIN